MKLGQGTSWCTATNSERKWYDQYTEEDNKLYVMINKNDSSEKYQWNSKERYTANKYDNPVNEFELCLKYNDLTNFFEKFEYTNQVKQVRKIMKLQSEPYIYNEEEECMSDTVRKYVKEVIVAEGTERLGDLIFKGCSNLTKITLPNSLTRIMYGCFQGCEKLTSIEILNSVTTIGDAAFLRCESLVSISIPNSLTYLGKRCFLKCSSLQSIIIPKGVTYVGDNCFERCTCLTSIEMPDSVDWIGYGCFEECPEELTIYIYNNYYVRGRCRGLGINSLKK